MSPLLIWILVVTIAALTVGLTVISYLRARSREANPHARTNVASQGAPVAVAEEVRAIGEQIERAMAEQRVQGETQRQLLTQKLDSVRQSVDGQRTQVDGLRSELRHEVQRRDAELAEIREQLGSIARGGALPPAAALALPPAPEPPRETATAPMIEETTFAPSAPADVLPAATASFDAEPTPEPVSTPPAEVSTSFSEETFAEASFEEAAFEDASAEEATAVEPVAEEPSFEETSFEETSVEPEPVAIEEDPAAPASVDPFGDLSFEAPVSEVPTFEEASFDESSFEDASFEEVPFEEASFEETPFEEASFEDVAFDEVLSMDPAPLAPAATDDSFSEVTFASATPQGEDSFATAPLNIGGDSAPAGDAFDEWTPQAVAPAATSAPAPIAPVMEASVVEVPASEPASPTPTPQPPTPETAWIARPDRPESADAIPTMASTDDFVFASPEPAPEPTDAPAEAPATGLIDLDALVAATASTPAEPAAPAVAAPDPAPAPAEPAIAAAPEAPVPAEAAMTDAPEPMDEPEEAPVPEGAEDLTVISSIDEDVQRLLYLEGVLTLEEIAQWGRGQARRISSRVRISEETILNQWVFEAQAAMFSRFSKQATS